MKSLSSKTTKNRIDYFTIVFLCMICFTGTFHEYQSCIFSIALIIGLIICFKKSSASPAFYLNVSSISIFLICSMYLISSIWAVDSGMAVIGFFKYIPILLFMLAIMQKKHIEEQIYEAMPYISVFMVIVSFVFMQIPALNEYFSVADRLAGFFQYPNTFAILLLVSELLIVRKTKLDKFDYITGALLIIGLILTGSRTVFVLAVISNIVMILFVADKKYRKLLLGGLLLTGVLAIAILFFTGEEHLAERFFRFSLGESTFSGRLLYFQDAIPLILQHPFGTGYMGHYYLQQAIQTGVYSIRYIHNDFLQIILDIGWLPCLLLAGAVIKALISRKNELYKKIILAVMCLHACFDFDFQFISIFCLFITFLMYDEGRKFKCEKNSKITAVLLAVFAAVNLYMGAALLMSHINQCEVSHKLYPWNTQNELKRIMLTDDLYMQEKIAEEIIVRNENVVLCYSVKARSAYQKGDFNNLIRYKHHIFDIAPFQYDEYEEYCYMMINGISLYSEIGDAKSAGICLNELIFTENKLNGTENKLSDLGRKIYDQPETELPEDIQKYIKQQGVIQE